MDASNKPKLHPVMWVAAVSVIVLSLAGVGAITGMIPTVGSKSADPAAVQAAKTPETASLANAPATAAVPAEAPMAPIAPPAQHVEKKHHSTSRTAAVPPPTMAQAGQPAVAPPVCRECGTIEAVRQVEVKGEGTGLGAVGGAVVGGLVGSNIGAGRGKDAMTVLGDVGGGLAGHQIEKNVRKKVHFDVVVRFDDGTSRTFSQEQAPAWRSGDRVRLVNGQLAALN